MNAAHQAVPDVVLDEQSLIRSSLSADCTWFFVKQ